MMLGASDILAMFPNYPFTTRNTSDFEQDKK